MTVIPGPPFPGAYEHYKGGLYVVHKVITDTTDITGRNGKIMVLYESLEKKKLHVRDIVEFMEHVHVINGGGVQSWHYHLFIDNGGCEDCVPRFRLLDMSEHMPGYPKTVDDASSTERK